LLQNFKLEASYLALTTNVALTVIQRASVHDQIAATREIVALEERQLALIRRQFELGGRSRADVLQQQSSLASVRAALPPLEQQLAMAEHQLTVLTGHFPHDAARADFDLSDLQLPQDLPVSLPSSLVAQRPDIKAQEMIRLWWLTGLGAAALLAAAGVWMFTGTREHVALHGVAAKAAATESAASGSAASGSGAPAGGSLLDASGYVVALREATVSAKSIYKVNEVLVQEGQAVKRGEVMARLDDTNARAALEQSKAQVKQLEAALTAAKLAADDARPSFVRNQAQLAEGLISPQTFEASKASYDAAQTAALVAEQSLAVTKATVEINQRYEDDTVIKAPFDGVVTVKSAQPGEIVSPQFLGGGGIAKIVDMDSLEAEVDVSENFINRVHSKQAASITLNAYPDWQIPAEVIAVIPTADRSKATVKVRIAFKQKDPRIVPEMGVRVSFLSGSCAGSSGGTGQCSAL
jgi:RND family efflux transporter MFP subunit